MAISLEEMRSRNRGAKRPTEQFVVDEDYVLTIGGIASFSAIKSRRTEVHDLKELLTAMPLTDADGNVVPVDDELFHMAVVVACGIHEPAGLTVKDVLELSVAYPFQFGALFDRVAELNAEAVKLATDEAEQRLAMDPTTPPASESPSDTAESTSQSGT